MNKKLFKCLLWKGLWGASVLSLIAAWLSLKSGMVLGIDAQTWFWNALIFAVLSISIKFDCHSCDACKISKK